ncbi:hypothetical protein [Anaplasma centrale]|uniref:hypothetical protein n=1 Tax=Anaplasma centrale TaxID=769 RepID=UPI0003094816|nr:hypothetical protein [Anaplasma centrale]
MGDVKRFRKEVVDSIGAGTASPVRAVFSSAVLGSAVPSADGDTFLMGEMVGVDEGLVIQELSRADELVKLQHELEKQVSKLAELGELKWLEELEKLQAEEIQKVKDSIGEMETKLQTEVKKAKEAAFILEIEKIKEPGDLDLLEAKKIQEVKAAKKAAAEGVTGLGKKIEGVTGLLGKKIEGLTEKNLGELETHWLLKRLGKHKDKLKALGEKLEELAVIKKLKELGLEERLRELAEVKEVKRLAERQKAGELDVQGGLQLTEKIKALSVDMVGRLEARRLGEEGGLAEKLGILGRLASGERSQALADVKVTLKQLKEMTEKKIKEKSLVERSVGMLGWLVGFGERVVTGKEALGDILKGKELVKLEKTLAKIKALEELTEIAEKRGVATVMKAALTGAMEITKNRGCENWPRLRKVRVDSDSFATKLGAKNSGSGRFGHV